MSSAKVKNSPSKGEFLSLELLRLALLRLELLRLELLRCFCPSGCRRFADILF